MGANSDGEGGSPCLFVGQENQVACEELGRATQEPHNGIGKGATRRLTIYAFDPSASQHVILVKELASRRSARESRGGAADERQCLSTLLGSTHTDMKRARGPMAVHKQQRERR